MTELPIDALEALKLIGPDRVKARPHHNEKVLACQPAGSGVIAVIFHRCLGPEPKRGVRTLMLRADQGAWMVASETFVATPGELLSRRGDGTHATWKACVHDHFGSHLCGQKCEQAAGW